VWRFGAVGSDVGSDQRSYSTPGPVSTGMDDRIGVQLPVWQIYLSLTNHAGQLSLAILLWVGAMSTGQRAVMLCDWGVKAEIVLFAGNTVWSISERVRGVCVDTLYKSTFTYNLFLYVWQSSFSFCQLFFRFSEISVGICWYFADMLNKEPPWCEGETCLACNTRFGITTRRHHWYMQHFIICSFASFSVECYTTCGITRDIWGTAFPGWMT